MFASGFMLGTICAIVGAVKQSRGHQSRAWFIAAGALVFGACVYVGLAYLRGGFEPSPNRGSGSSSG